MLSSSAGKPDSPRSSHGDPAPTQKSNHRTLTAIASAVALTVAGGLTAWVVMRTEAESRARELIAGTSPEEMKDYLDRRASSPRPPSRARRRAEAPVQSIEAAPHSERPLVSNNTPDVFVDVKLPRKSDLPFDPRWSDAVDIQYVEVPEDYMAGATVLDRVKTLLPFEIPEDKMSKGLGKIEDYVTAYALKANPTLTVEELDSILAKAYAAYKLYAFLDEAGKFLKDRGDNQTRTENLAAVMERLSDQEVAEVGRRVNDRSWTDHVLLGASITPAIDELIDLSALDPSADFLDVRGDLDRAAAGRSR